MTIRHTIARRSGSAVGVLAAFLSGVLAATLAGGPATARELPGPPGRSVTVARPAGADDPLPAVPDAPPVVGRAAPAVAPVTGGVLRPFDPPASPYGRGHRGVDLAAAPGEPVRAALAGTVRFAGPAGGVHWVTVEHAGGLSTTYGGFVVTVRAGQRVGLGAALGRATRRGRVDWGARQHGAYVDPLGLLAGWVLRLVPVR